jgi:N-acetylglucosaminyldiphosphoundecaprenol N-acetyl-beta-D-mannosaminyltransferase
MSQPEFASPSFPVCDLLGMPLARVDSVALLDHVFGALARGRGGWLVTANLDFLRRHARDLEARTLYAAADIRVADGMPLVWAARLQGDPLPERVCGSALIWLLVERAAREGRSLYFLGGDARANEKAAEVLRRRCPAVTICGSASPTVSSPPTPEQIAGIRREVLPAEPALLLVGMGSPKQEQIIRALRADLPRSWLIGVGASFSFVAGEIRRAPRFMQSAGLEWLWRLGQEPRRLARRYIVDDLPFAFELFARALARRCQRHASDRPNLGDERRDGLLCNGRVRPIERQCIACLSVLSERCVCSCAGSTSVSTSVRDAGSSLSRSPL